jgi:hypothetical protein
VFGHDEDVAAQGDRPELGVVDGLERVPLVGDLRIRPHAGEFGQFADEVLDGAVVGVAGGGGLRWPTATARRS